MDDGIKSIFLIISVLFISLFFFVYVFRELILVFFLISLTLIPLLVYTCLLVITNKWDTYTLIKEWDQVEKIKKIQMPPVDVTLQEQKKQ
jgi:hypothetical protein